MQKSLRLSLKYFSNLKKKIDHVCEIFLRKLICNFGSARYFDTNITDSALNMTFVF